MSAFPKGHHALVAAGYIFKGQAACKTPECAAKIFWYKAPSGQVMAVDAITQTEHWKSCAGTANRHKKKKAIPPPSIEPQGSLFAREPGQDG